MAKILSHKKNKRARRWQKIKNFFFRIWPLRKMRKRISKIYYKEQVKREEPIKELIIYAHALKYDKAKIEKALTMFVERDELVRFEPVKKGDSKDAYLLIFPTENRSQSRILAEVPEEIDLNSVKLEPIPQNIASGVPSTESNQPQAEPSAPTDKSSEEDISKPF